MRTVLVPTDFSENAFNALKYACQVFKYENCRIYILHAYTNEVYGATILEKGSFEELKKSNLIDSERKLKEELSKIKSTIDIVVMGTRGMTNDRIRTFCSNQAILKRFTGAECV